ncbi:MAG: RNA pseudouridine synthase [Planctomycetota bacterium]|nr:RNA pseudouridine synthase [Planctomycetota bacterium]
MSNIALTVIYEDNHLLAISKPANLPTMGVAPDKDSLLTVAKQYIRQKYAKPGNVYLGIVSRLDAPVTGLIMIARTSKAATRLNESFRGRQARKIYWALVEGVPAPPAATCVDWLRKDERHHRVHVTRPHHPEAHEARLAYRTLAVRGGYTLLEIELETGRKHQIRVQLAQRGHPVLGDRKYGATMAFPVGIALHSRQLELLHPVRHTPLQLVAPLPVCWRRFGILENADS